MATRPPDGSLPRRLGAAVTRWFSSRGAAELPPQSPARTPSRSSAQASAQADWSEELADPVSLTPLSGTPNRQVRSRLQIYTQWQDMAADAVVHAALRLHVTAALGGHESRGEMVFIEATPEAKKDKKLEALVISLAKDLQPLFNRISPTLAFNAAWLGDGYGRIYAEPDVGVRDVYTDDLVFAPLVQPYERGNTTVGYTVATSDSYHERLTVLQMVRMKMPRVMLLPQSRTVEKALRVTLQTDRLEDLPALPASAGGSFLDGAEVAFARYSAATSGLVGQRVQDSINETLISVSMANMNPKQRKQFTASLQAMFERTNAYIEQVVSKGRAVFSRLYHMLPTFGDKQVTEIRGQPSAGRPASLTIDDVMMHARFLAGALGCDLSMLGFADQLGGGLGEGGFFRVSAQSAERARMIRCALSEALDHIVSVHALLKHGLEFDATNQPWVINYFSGISALETERAKTKADSMNSGALLVQTMAQIKELGLDEPAIANLLEKEFGMDADAAKMYAKALAEAAKKAAEQGGMGGGDPGGGFGQGEPRQPDDGVQPVEG